MHRLTWLRRQPGVYAFVVGGEVRYIGKAGQLHGRLRNYSRRSFGSAAGRALRKVHRGIRETVWSGATVSVYALLALPGDELTIEQIEARLIAQAQPDWNAT